MPKSLKKMIQTINTNQQMSILFTQDRKLLIS